MHDVIKELNQMMRSAIKEIELNDTYCYHESHAKQHIILSRKSNRIMYNVITEIKSNNA